MTTCKQRPTRTTLGVLVLTACIWLTPAIAQPGSGGRGPGMTEGLGPGMMMGPGMMRGRGMQGRMCSPGMAGFAVWRVNAIEQAIKPDENQQKKLDAYKDASAKAAEAMRNSCPTEFPVTPTARLEFMEKRMEAMLQAIKALRPAFEDFYNSLNDEQKAKLSAASRGSRRFWRWRDRW
jgi:hypothetical protein